MNAEITIPDEAVRQAAGTETLAAVLRAQMSAIAARLDARADGLSSQVQVLTGQVDGLDGRIDGLGGRVDGLDGRVTALEPQPAPEPVPEPPAPADDLWHHATWPVPGTDLAAITSGLPGVRINQAGPALTGGVPVLASEGGVLRIRHAGPHGHYVARWPRQPAAGEFWGYSYRLTNERAQTDREDHMGCLAEQGAIHFVHTAICAPPGTNDLIGGAWIHGMRRLYWSHLAGDVRIEARSGVTIAADTEVVVQGVIEWLSPDTFRAWPRLLAADGTVLALPEDYVLTDQSNARLVGWYASGRVLRRNTANPDGESIRDFSVGAAQNDGNPSGAHYRVRDLKLGYVTGPGHWFRP